MLSGLLALVSAAAFSGAAIYIHVAEQPARRALDDGSLLVAWKLSYARATPMQAGLALISGVLGFAALWAEHDTRWLLGAVLMIAKWPWTLLAIMPINHRLEATGSADAATRALIERWEQLHAVRSALGVSAVVAYLWALV